MIPCHIGSPIVFHAAPNEVNGKIRVSVGLLGKDREVKADSLISALPVAPTSKPPRYLAGSKPLIVPIGGEECCESGARSCASRHLRGEIQMFPAIPFYFLPLPPFSLLCGFPYF